ncbi:DsrE family protein [Haloplanus sp. C73]|uniref:DsrE family protein n=1 Tax=Haloplanus sp. C73 TaxID=3421641 RepID=UPI003EBB7CDB
MRTVFHHSDADRHSRTVSNVANLLDDETVTLDDVALVTNAGGLELVVADSPERERVEALLDRGIAIKQCRNTLRGADVTAADLIDGVEIVPSGVGELTRLQDAGYAYISP